MSIASNLSFIENSSGAITTGTINAPSAPITFSINSTEDGRFDTNGYFLVGYTTSQGAYRLQVNGSLYASGSIIGNITGNVTGTVSTASNVAGGTAGQIVYQTAPGLTGFAGPGTAGQILTSAGTSAPVYVNTSSFMVGISLVSNTSTNIAGGTAGQVPYQTAAGQTNFIGPGTAGQILVSNGASAPVYTNTSSIGVGFVSNPLTIGTGLSGTSYNGSSAVTIANTGVLTVTGSTNQVLVNGGTASANGNITLTLSTSTMLVNMAVNVTGGAAGSLLYQSGANATTSLALGTSGYVLTAGASAPQWTAVSGLSAGNATNASNIATVAQTASASYYPTFVSANNATSSYMAEYTTSSFTINPSTGAVTLNSLTVNGSAYIGGAFTATGLVSLAGNQYNGGIVSITDQVAKTSAQSGILVFGTTTAGANDYQFIIGRSAAGTGAYHSLQSVEQGVGYRTLAFQPVGGNVSIGTSSNLGKLYVADSGTNQNTFNITRPNSSGVGDWVAQQIAYAGSWSTNSGAMALTIVTDTAVASTSSNTVGAYGIGFDGAGFFGVKGLYSGGYSASPMVFKVTPGISYHTTPVAVVYTSQQSGAALSVNGGAYINGTVTATNFVGNISGSASSLSNALTFNNGGSGAASGSTFNGSSAVTISYNTIGAPLASQLANGSASGTAYNSIVSLDSRATNYAPGDRSAGFFVDFRQNSADGLSDGGTYHGVLTFRPYGFTNSDFSGGQAHQLGTTDNGNLWHRISSSTSTWGSWYKIIDTGNINAYVAGGAGYTGNINATANTNAFEYVVGVSASGSTTAAATVATSNPFGFNASNGFVGVGTTSPSNRFSVSNNGAMGLEISPTGGYTGITGVDLLSYNRSGSSYGGIGFVTNSNNNTMVLTTGGSLVMGAISVYNATTDIANFIKTQAGVSQVVVSNQQSSTGFAGLSLAAYGGSWYLQAAGTATANNTNPFYIQYSANSAPTATILPQGTVIIGSTATSTSTMKFDVHGTNGELFSVIDSMSGTIFSVNDISGIPSIYVQDTGQITLAQYNGFVTIGTSTQMISGAGLSVYTATSILSLNVGSGSGATTGQINASGEITAYYSDRRLKENVKPIDNAVTKVLSLNGITYTPNALAETFGYDRNQSIVGLFADEVEAVLPQAVKPAPFDQDTNGNSKSGENYKTVQYEKLVPLLIEAIKELKAEIEELKSKK